MPESTSVQAPASLSRRTQPERIIAILGMHRSGTSCLAGSLQAGGLELGKHHTWNEYNRKGNRENEDVVQLHEGLLRANDGSWDHPPLNPTWEQRHLDRATEILAEYADTPIWGFKDPRALIFLEGWLDLCPHIEMVGIYRHPMVVAQSLHARKALPITIEHALNLWRAYNIHLLDQLRKAPFPLLCFDWHEDTFHEKLNQVHQQLNLKPLEDDQRFYSSELHKHHLDEDAALPDEIVHIYDELNSFAL